MKYLFNSLIGVFVFDNQFNPVEEVRYKEIKEYKKGESWEKIKKKYKDGKEVPEEKLGKVLDFLRGRKYFDSFYLMNQELTKQKIKEAVSPDLLIIQAISSVEELTKISNILAKRLREWQGWHLPELGERIGDDEQLAKLVAGKSRKELMKETGIKESMGAELGKEDEEEIKKLGKELLGIYKLKEDYEGYLKKTMKGFCPNLLELAGATIGAKLIELGKGLKHLALLPASTIQLLGAEKALFRHIKTGAKSPKYGVIVNHLIVQRAGKGEKGKAARRLADKLSLCARLDYFKGEFKAPEFRKELEEKFIKNK